MFLSASCFDLRRLGRRILASLPALLLLVLCLSGIAPADALAQNTVFQRSYIEPFPPGDRYRVLVVGDSLADGVWSGLYRAFQEDGNMDVINKSKPSSGFVRVDSYDWTKELDDILKDETFQIVVVMFGANDNQAIKSGKEYVKPGTDAWDELYGQRVEAFIKKLRAKGLAVYWTGLPIMRSPDDSDDAEALNDIYREKSFINGAKFIDTWSGFTDESGRYSAVGPDMSGQIRRLRDDDGVHFTPRGYLKLAHFAEKEIRRDLSLAKLERNIPLAGNVDEQANVMGRVVSPGKPVPPSGTATDAPAEGASEPAQAEAPAGDQAQGGAPAAEGEAAEAAPPAIEQSKVGEVDVVRPVISQTTLDAAQNMTPQGVASSLSDSENISSDLPGGLTALASISAVSDPSVASSKPRLPLAQRPYYRVLIKGEQLKPKAGRADDFSWPRS
ncbi:SGNH/GDSL hydrolase family protein [Methyloceanibacter sp.]|uniref:SGNH/GDSL hydrolase family protein n=1 Tax=Methyloceanibacter sp. TaxID=1965321 RepID=UPI003D6D75A8